MAVRQRRLREVAKRERLFLDTARALIRRDGLLKLQMARLAQRCDYAVGTLYQHFASKEDLLVALATDNVQHRVDLFRRVAAWDAPTRDRMLGIAVADVMFVRRYPEHFRLAQLAFTDVVWSAASPARRRQALAASRPLGETVIGLIEEARKRGDLKLHGLRPSELSFGPWALTIGVHDIVHIEGVLEQHDVRDPYRLMLRHFQHLLNGLEWKPHCDPADRAALDRKIQRLCHEVFDGELCL